MREAVREGETERQTEARLKVMEWGVCRERLKDKVIVW